MQLDSGSVEWAISFFATKADGDLFPPLPEFRELSLRKEELTKSLTTPEVKDLEHGASKRFLVPKDALSYRQATQLDAQDALVATSIVHQFGHLIEKRRLSERQVFSYRFRPTAQNLYAENNGWNQLWAEASRLSRHYSHVLVCDIADFYNQIYHHTLENQLIESGFPNQATTWLKSLISSTTAQVSRGIPVGPHAMHLLAEATLIPIDNSLANQGLTFLRYVDDIMVFTRSRLDAEAALRIVAQTLDKQQRLSLQRNKTFIYESSEIGSIADGMVHDQPISESEKSLLMIIDKYAKGDPYRTVWFEEISEADWRSISEEAIEGILRAHLDKPTIDFPRIAWLFRRLAQIGHPGALSATLPNLNVLTPCLPSVVAYLASLTAIEPSKWKAVGAVIADLLNQDRFRDEEYYQMMLISLFARNSGFNHVAKIIAKYKSASHSARRQILLTAHANNAVDWIREQKEGFSGMDAGERLAYMYAASQLPADERKHFFQHLSFSRPLEKAFSHIARGGGIST